jgi:tetratricopeptide (TPR) repeat protein
MLTSWRLPRFQRAGENRNKRVDYVKKEGQAMTLTKATRELLAVGVVFLCACSGQEGRSGTGALPDFDALWDYDHPESTEAAFRRLLPLAEEAGDLPYRAELLTQIARAQGLQMDFHSAHRTLDSVDAMLDEGIENMDVARARSLLERGRVYNSSNEPDSAKPFFLEAWNLARNEGEDFYAVDAAHMMAMVGPPEEQLVWSEKAMRLAEQSADERAGRWLGSLYNNTGWTYHDMGNYEKALELFEKALAWNKQNGTEGRVRIARWTVARAYRSMGRVEEALTIQKDLEREIEEKGLDTDGYVLEEIGECLLLLGRQDEARPYFARAYEHLSRDRWLEANQADRLQRLKNLGE